MTYWILLLIFSSGSTNTLALPNEVTCHNVAKDVQRLAMQSELSVVYFCEPVEIE